MPYIIAGCIILVLVYFLISFNILITLRNKVRNQKSQIDVELRNRFELIPNLIETVQGYKEHEKSLLENVIKARNTYENSKRDTSNALEADTMLTSSLSNLFALSEDYPELKANSNFLGLQNSLLEAEQKISYFRQFYNDAVFKLNNKIEMFPSNIIAKIFKIQKEMFFEATDEEKKNIEIKL